MDRYIGIDAHGQSCTLGVVGPSGKRLRSVVVETNGQALVEAVRSVVGRRHICLEEGTQSAWLYELLSPFAEDVVVTVPPESRGSKDDVRDAWKRAEELRVGGIQTRVYKAPAYLAGLRNAVRAYVFAVRDVVRAKNRLKSVFLSRGVCVDAGAYDPDRRNKWLKRLPIAHRQLADRLARQLDELEPLRDEAEEWLLKESKTHPIIRKLNTGPGMGAIRSAIVVSVVADPHRFRTSRQFWSYCGLAVVTHSSANWIRDRHGKLVRAENTYTRGLTRKRNASLKAVFKGAATTVMAQLPEHPLSLNYQRMLTAGIKPNLAKLTLARQIAAIVLSMWKHGEAYDPERQRRVVTDQA
jgi:transposase